jgi:hypothetical protein
MVRVCSARRHELVMDLALHEQPRARAADLPGIGEDRRGRSGHRLVEIGIGKDDVGRFAAQLHVTRFMVEAAACRIFSPTPVEPVKAILSIPGCMESAARHRPARSGC